MKAIVTTRQGPPDVLELRDVPTPSPASNEVLIRVHAATVTTGDLMLRKLHPLLFPLMRLFGTRRKKIPGHEFAGVVESAGADVTRFKPGDRVFGTTTGLETGANAEFVCLPEARKGGVLAVMPENLSFEQAAALPVGGMTALYLLRQGGVETGKAVLVYGASGSVGSFGVQIARALGAQVTGVAGPANQDLVRELGAVQVLDYTREDFTESGETYDVIFDAVGKLDANRAKGALNPGGSYVTVASTTQESNENFIALTEMAEAGDVMPAIDRVFPLEKTAEAHAYVETGRKRGNVVIAVVPAAGDEKPADKLPGS